MPDCKNCIHNAVCDMASRFIEAFVDNNGICTDYKDKSLIVEALRKQIPRKPEKREVCEGGSFLVLSCPTCGKPVVSYLNKTVKPPHCMMCGQAIDWGDKNA